MARKLIVIYAVPFLAAIAASPVVAKDVDALNDASFWNDITLSANLGASTQYRFRGLMQTNNKPAIQGGFDLTHPSGFYLGNWNSNVSWLSDSSDKVSAPLEMDFYGGYKGKITQNITIDTGVMQYYYPGDYPSSYTSPDTTELYIGFGYGPMTFKYSHALTNLFGVADSKNSQYYNLSGSFPTPLWGLTIDAHVGYQNLKHMDNGSYTDWSLGLTKNWDKGFSTSLAYVDTNADEAVYTNTKSRYIGKAAVVFSVAKSL
jgi:uncharacterized protein (TIGR02001 family)